MSTPRTKKKAAPSSAKLFPLTYQKTTFQFDEKDSKIINLFKHSGLLSFSGKWLVGCKKINDANMLLIIDYEKNEIVYYGQVTSIIYHPLTFENDLKFNIECIAVSNSLCGFVFKIAKNPTPPVLGATVNNFEEEGGECHSVVIFDLAEFPRSKVTLNFSHINSINPSEPLPLYRVDVRAFPQNQDCYAVVGKHKHWKYKNNIFSTHVVDAKTNKSKPVIRKKHSENMQISVTAAGQLTVVQKLDKKLHRKIYKVDFTTLAAVLQDEASTSENYSQYVWNGTLHSASPTHMNYFQYSHATFKQNEKQITMVHDHSDDPYNPPSTYPYFLGWLPNGNTLLRSDFRGYGEFHVESGLQEPIFPGIEDTWSRQTFLDPLDGRVITISDCTEPNTSLRTYQIPNVTNYWLAQRNNLFKLLSQYPSLGSRDMLEIIISFLTIVPSSVKKRLEWYLPLRVDVDSKTQVEIHKLYMQLVKEDEVKSIVTSAGYFNGNNRRAAFKYFIALLQDANKTWRDCVEETLNSNFSFDIRVLRHSIAALDSEITRIDRGNRCRVGCVVS